MCKATLIEKDGQCIPCDEESLWCPVGSTIEKLNSASPFWESALVHEYPDG